jgi:hypothetical protein
LPKKICACGEGEFAGLAQTGGGSLLGSVVSDFALYMRAKSAADAVVARDPELLLPEHAALGARASAEATVRATQLSS